jgi:hypothetical protein
MQQSLARLLVGMGGTCRGKMLRQNAPERLLAR